MTFFLRNGDIWVRLSDGTEIPVRTPDLNDATDRRLVRTLAVLSFWSASRRQEQSCVVRSEQSRTVTRLRSVRCTAIE